MQIATSLFIKPISGCVFITMDHDISPIFRDKNVRCAVALYSVYSFAVVGEHEMYSLWSASSKGRVGGRDVRVGRREGRKEGDLLGWRGDISDNIIKLRCYKY